MERTLAYLLGLAMGFFLGFAVAAVAVPEPKPCSCHCPKITQISLTPAPEAP